MLPAAGSVLQYRSHTSNKGRKKLSWPGRSMVERRFIFFENSYFSMQTRYFLCHLTLSHFPVHARIITLFSWRADPSQIEAKLREPRGTRSAWCLCEIPNAFWEHRTTQQGKNMPCRELPHDELSWICFCFSIFFSFSIRLEVLEHNKLIPFTHS